MFNIKDMLEQYAHIKAIYALTSTPSKSYSLRELAAKAGISPGASKQALDYMRQQGMVNLTVVGRSHLHKANLESALCRQWKILFNLEHIEKSGALKELINRVGYAHAILLYGSFAQGTNDEKSDIDLLVITQKPEKIDLRFVKTFGREANIMHMSLGEWKKKAMLDKIFYENVIYDSIVLYGKRPVIT